MSDPQPATASPDAADPLRDRPDACVDLGAWTGRTLRSLERLADVGVELAETLRPSAARAAEADGAPVVRDPGLAYARVSRSVRLSWALGAQLIKDTQAATKEARKHAAERAERAVDKAETDREMRAENRRDNILGAVAETLIERETPEKEADAVIRTLYQWLEEDEPDRKLSRTPLATVVAMVYEDLERPFDAAKWATETRTIEDAAEPPDWVIAARAAAAATAQPAPPASTGGRDPPSG